MNAQPEVLTGELMPAPDRTLFQTDDPAEVLDAARSVADALKGALQAGGMVQRIGQTEHVKIDGWQTLGSMLGIAPYVVWSRPIDNGWEARAEARTADGRVVGAAEAMCTHAERNWRGSEEYALRSMAQTRAMSKALRGPLGFIITLAGHSATPAEEADDNAATPEFGPAASEKQYVRAGEALTALYGGDSDKALEALGLIEADAGGYVPRLVARAVMRIAALRPGRVAATGTGAGGVEQQDATPDGDETPAEQASDRSDTEEADSSDAT